MLSTSAHVLMFVLDLADEEDVGPKDTGSGEPAGLEDDASPAGSKKVGMRQKLKDRLHIGRNKD